MMKILSSNQSDPEAMENQKNKDKNGEGEQPTPPKNKKPSPGALLAAAVFRESLAWLLLAGILTSGVVARYARYFLEPTQRGFFCGDTSIRLPYRQNTVPYNTMLIVGNVLVLLTAFFCECVYRKNSDQQKGRRQKAWRVYGDLKIPVEYVRLVLFFVLFQLGYLAHMALVDLVKLAIGSLRPHFLAVCQPIFTGNMTLSECPPMRYVDPDEYECVGGNFTARELQDARLSFFSGHTSTAFYFAAFTILYIHVRVCHRSSVRLVPRMALFAVYTVLTVGAACVGVSRIFDHKHHPVDVFVGLVVGIASATAIVTCFWTEFAAENDGKRGEEQQNQPDSSSFAAAGDSTISVENGNGAAGGRPRPHRLVNAAHSLSLEEGDTATVATNLSTSTATVNNSNSNNNSAAQGAVVGGGGGRNTVVGDFVELQRYPLPHSQQQQH